MDIETKELQQEVKGFLKDSKSTWIEILEHIYLDYCTQKIGEHMRATSIKGLGTTIIRRWKTGYGIDKLDATGGGKVHTILPKRGFPNNTVRLLPSEYYYQFCDCYTLIANLVGNRSLDNIAWISNFKFNFERRLYREI